MLWRSERQYARLQSKCGWCKWFPRWSSLVQDIKTLYHPKRCIYFFWKFAHFCWTSKTGCDRDHHRYFDPKHINKRITHQVGWVTLQKPSQPSGSQSAPWNLPEKFSPVHCSALDVRFRNPISASVEMENVTFVARVFHVCVYIYT